MKLKKLLLKVKPIKYYVSGKYFFNNEHYKDVQSRTRSEKSKRPYRTEIINFLLSMRQTDTQYLEIGVRNPNHNFNKIKSTRKYSVDPGLAFEGNPVDFKMTSDEFFQRLSTNEILSNDVKFDVIFIDGLHLAQQVDKDIANALNYIKEDGFIVLHDCNPPTEWHARENFDYANTPANRSWNGTTWKAFLKWRSNSSLNSCCIDTDWGVGIISKAQKIGNPITAVNPFFEFALLDENRKEYLNLIDFETLKKRLGK
ncbi:class I SAM-dependent methyltransferase [Chryseolinea sp. T2]|uniref:class I SAM-dependent methyltransferase n=1 Tax=Chryseolinea sp. T2 TaxID=3129255 RepID=UPI003077C25B